MHKVADAAISRFEMCRTLKQCSKIFDHLIFARSTLTCTKILRLKLACSVHLFEAQAIWSYVTLTNHLQTLFRLFLVCFFTAKKFGRDFSNSDVLLTVTRMLRIKKVWLFPRNLSGSSWVGNQYEIVFPGFGMIKTLHLTLTEKQVSRTQKEYYERTRCKPWIFAV